MTVYNNNINLDSHYSKNMKVKRPNIHLAEAPQALHNTKLFSKKDADKKMEKIDNDIYEGTEKERKKHGFNISLYIKIFIGIGIAVAVFTGFDKIKRFFKK